MTVADLWAAARRARRGPGRLRGRRARSPAAEVRRAAPVGPLAAAAVRCTARDRLRRRGVHARRGRHPPALLHQPRRPGVRPGQPARGGQGRAVRPLLRSPKSLRRLFLDEFVGDLDITGDADHRRHRRPAAGRGALRPGLLRVRRRLGRPARRGAPGLRAGLEPAHQGARVGPAHVATSSSRPATSPTTPASAAATASTATPRCSARRSAPATSATWTACSTPTPSCCPCSQDFFRDQFPKDPDDSDFVYRQAIRAKAFDALRGILPAASLSNVGIYGTGQGYEQLLLRMRAHPLPEARALRRPDAHRAAQGDPVAS